MYGNGRHKEKPPKPPIPKTTGSNLTGTMNKTTRQEALIPMNNSDLGNQMTIKLRKAGFRRDEYYGNEIFSITGIIYDRCFNTPTYIKYLIPKVNRDKILNEPITRKLKEAGYDIVLSPKDRAVRSLYCRQLDFSVGQLSAEEIKDTIQKKNPWLKVDAIHKIKNYTHVFKLICKTEEMAKKALEHGIYAGNTRITPQQISVEEYEDILICFHCYKLESHVTNECPDSERPKPCSECSAIGHTFRECTANFKKCLNCNGNHRTTAMKCPIRKKKVQEKKERKKKEEMVKENKKYAEVVKATINTEELRHPKIEVNNNYGYLATFGLVYAHFQNMIEPGSFNKHLQQYLKINKLPAIKIPEGQKHSERLFQMTMKNINNPIINLPGTEDLPETEEDHEHGTEENEEEEENTQFQGIRYDDLPGSGVGYDTDNTSQYEDNEDDYTQKINQMQQELDGEYYEDEIPPPPTPSQYSQADFYKRTEETPKPKRKKEKDEPTPEEIEKKKRKDETRKTLTENTTDYSLKFYSTRDYKKKDTPELVKLIKSGHIRYTYGNTLHNNPQVTRRLLAGEISIDKKQMYQVEKKEFNNIKNGDAHHYQ